MFIKSSEFQSMLATIERLEKRVAALEDKTGDKKICEHVSHHLPPHLICKISLWDAIDKIIEQLGLEIKGEDAKPETWMFVKKAEK